MEWNQTLNEKGPWTRTAREAFQLGLMKYVFASQYVAGNRVLDIASGAGYGASYIAGKGGKVISGDISQESVRWATRQYKRQGLEFVVLDCTRLPFGDESFDMIVTLETIEHLIQYNQFLAECKRVLIKGGTIICSTPNHAVSDYTDEHVSLFHIDELRQLLGKYFQVSEIYAHHITSQSDRINNSLLVIASRVLSFVPGQTRVKDFVTRFIWRRYRRVVIPTGCSIDEVVIDEKYREIMPVNDIGSRVAGSLIAVCIK